MPQNFLNSIPITATLLMFHATASLVVSSFFFQREEIEADTTLEDADNEVREDVTETASNALITQDNGNEVRNKRGYLLVIWATLSLISLVASISMAPILMHLKYNTCPDLPSSKYSNITCDHTTPFPILGTTCKLTCPKGYPSSGKMESTCSWTGRWSNMDMECSSTTGVLIVGESWGHGDDDQSVAEVFYATTVKHKNISVAPYPNIPHGAMAGYVDGTVLACGGFDGNVKASCYKLHRDATWSGAPPMLKERWFASSAVIYDGAALWVLGGMDNNDNADIRTMIFKNNEWEWGPHITSPRAGACSATMGDGDVVIAGGFGLHGNLDLVEKFSFVSMDWTTLPPLQHARYTHACSHVWLYPDGRIATAVNERSISSIVVAGGRTMDSSKVFLPVTSVEMLIGGKWIDLPAML